jgi:hypothetical protein
MIGAMDTKMFQLPSHKYYNLTIFDGLLNDNDHQSISIRIYT